MHNHHNRKTIRLKNYDYRQNGLYFITICSYHQQHLFGHIDNGEMFLNPNGKIANSCWQEIPNHFPHTHTLEYVIMPNHMHGIIMLDSNLWTRHAVSQLHNPDQYEKFGKPIPGSIPTIIRSYKSAVTKKINEKYYSPRKHIWQPRFWEHIIRNEKAYYKICNYIKNNPLNWKIDSN